MYTRISFFICCCLLLVIPRLKAQVSYPVMATVQLNPPYSLYLTDYAAPDVQRMQVHLLLKDLTETNYKCRLRLTIEGFGITLQSKAGFYTAPILLNGGEMTTLSGIDLAPYLKPQNLLVQGMDYNEFVRSGAKLPEGIYKYTVEVLDYTRNNVVSNASFAVVSTFLSYPPIINLPIAGTKVEAMDPQNVIFQWMPRHTASLNAAFSVAYKFRLVALIPANRDPNDALRTTRPLLETMTSQTILVYGPAEPALTPGNNYAVQVQAIEADGRDMFINDGFSEAVAFTYGEKCSVPSEIMAAVASSSSLKLTWAATTSQQSFTVRYREAGDTPSAWYEETVYTPQITITGLKAGKRYQYQVNGQCIWGTGDYSDTASFTMPDATLEKGDFVCGTSSATKIASTESIKTLNVYDTITAGDFKVILSKVTNTGGSFSGTGEVMVPFLNNLSLTVAFTNISVNKEKQLFNGVIELIQDDAKAVSANLEKTLTDLLDNIQTSLQNGDLASLQTLDAAGLLDKINSMQNWSELDPATKSGLNELAGKLQNVQQLLANNDMTQAEKESVADKLAADIKILADKTKSDLASMLEVLKELLGVYKMAVGKLRKDYTDEKVASLLIDANKAYQKCQDDINVIIGNAITALGGEPGNVAATGTGQVVVFSDTETTTTGANLESTIAYLKLEKEYNTAKIIQLMDKQVDDEDTKTLVLKNLKIEAATFEVYYKQKKAENTTDENMVDDVKKGIIQLIEKVLTENIYNK